MVVVVFSPFKNNQRLCTHAVSSWGWKQETRFRFALERFSAVALNYLVEGNVLIFLNSKPTCKKYNTGYRNEADEGVTSWVRVSSDISRLVVSPGPPGPFILYFKMFMREIVFKKRKNFFFFGLYVNSLVAGITE